MIVKIADNVMVSLPVKYIENGAGNTFILDGSQQPADIIKAGQSARVVTVKADKYETVMQRKIRSVKWEQEGVRVHLGATLADIK